MPAPKLLTYAEVSQYYYLIQWQYGEKLLVPKSDAPGWVSSLTALSRYPATVLVGQRRVSRGRVWAVLSSRADLTPDHDVVQVKRNEFKIVDRGDRLSPLKGVNYRGSKLKPASFEGTPMAGVSWLADRRMWYVSYKGTYIGWFKDYYDACNARLRAMDYRDSNTEVDEGGAIYPAPERMWIAKGPSSPVPRGYKRWITYSKHQDIYRLHKDGKTVKCSHELKTLTQEVDKWKANNLL